MVRSCEACLAQGFHQHSCLDCTKIFSLVIKPATIRTVLWIVIAKSWSIYQIDINNAFFQGNLIEKVYMAQPLGFINSNLLTRVPLAKIIYGLQQVLHAWYKELSLFLLRYGFVNSYPDSSLFIYHKDSLIIYFLVCVDDFIITESHDGFFC